MLQLVQVVGAFAILAAFTFAQYGVLGQRPWSYLVLNLGGAAVLAVLAYLERQWGFAARGVWTLFGGGPVGGNTDGGRVRTAADATLTRHADTRDTRADGRGGRPLAA